MKKILLMVLFFVITPLILGVSLLLLTNIQTKNMALSRLNKISNQFYSALPQVTGEVLGAAFGADARPVIIAKYLEKYHSPLLPYANELLQASDKYGVNYQLIMAIAQCESNLCKKSPPGSYNCWGFENGDTRFLSWEQALNQVAKTLKEGYLDHGLTTPEEIMPKYAPPSVEKGGPWAKCVNQFMKELEYGKF